MNYKICLRHMRENEYIIEDGELSRVIPRKGNNANNIMDVNYNIFESDEYPLSLNEKELFLDVLRILHNNGITVKYMNQPCISTKQGIIGSLTLRIPYTTTSQEIYKLILKEPKFINDCKIYIYKIMKVKVKDEFFYYMRIGEN